MLAVPLAGAVEVTGDPWLPFRVTDPCWSGGGVGVGVFPRLAGRGAIGCDAAVLWDGSVAVVPVSVGGRGRVESGDTYRGPRFLPLDAGVGQAFSPALAQTTRGARPLVDRGGLFGVGAGARGDGAARFLRVPSRGGQRADRQPVPAASVAAGWSGARASQSDGAAPQGADRVVSTEGAVPDSAQHPRRGVQRDLRPAALEQGPCVGGVLRVAPAPARRSCCRPRGAMWIPVGR